MAPMSVLELRWSPGWPIDLRTTLGPLAHGRGDPTARISAEEAWWVTRGAAGPATLRLRRVGDAVHARAWGPGAADELDRLPDTLGAGDDPQAFPAAAHPVMAQAYHRFGAGWRVLRTTRVLDALVPAVLEQRVTGVEAKRAWRSLVGALGEPAPGPVAGLRVPPTGQTWAQVPSWTWHRAGVDPGRARTIVAAARRGPSLERLSERPAAEARAALAGLPGIGTWTAAEVAVRAWGDVDAVSFGDFHLAQDVVWALAGRRDGTDADLARVLRPWTGQRARAVRLVQLHAGNPPRRGPRAAITDHRRW